VIRFEGGEQMLHCGREGCGHHLDRHRIDDVKVWTQRDRWGKIRESTMGYTMVCFDVCADHDPGAHQCHCKSWVSRMPPPTKRQLRELP
jgi:hypothetical protein